MQYPPEIPPKSNYRKITCSVTKHWLVRGTQDKETLHPSTGLVKDEYLADKDRRFLDYSTNLSGHYKLEHLGINFIGEDKRYFTANWDEESDPREPIFETDFDNTQEFGFFTIPISKIHRIFKVPYQKGKEAEADATAVVLHVPTNGNFWHFEIRWEDKDGELIPPGDSKWRNNLGASIRAAIRQYCKSEIDEEILLAREDYEVVVAD